MLKKRKKKKEKKCYNNCIHRDAPTITKTFIETESINEEFVGKVFDSNLFEAWD